MKSCSPLHPVNIGLLLLGAGAIGLAARGQGSRNAQIPDLSFAHLRDGQAVNTEHDYRANGVTFREEPRHESYGWVVQFVDGYGNRWDLIEILENNT